MIKIHTNEQSIVNQRIVKVLKDNFPGCSAKIVTGNLCVARRNWLTGIIIRQRKNMLVIRGNFPDPYLPLVFAVVTVFTGLIPGIMVYYFWLLPRMKRAEKEVAVALEQQLDSV